MNDFRRTFGIVEWNQNCSYFSASNNLCVISW